MAKRRKPARKMSESKKTLNPYQLCMKTEIPEQRKLVDKKHPNFTPSEAAKAALVDSSKICKTPKTS